MNIDLTNGWTAGNIEKFKILIEEKKAELAWLRKMAEKKIAKNRLTVQDVDDIKTTKLEIEHYQFILNRETRGKK